MQTDLIPKGNRFTVIGDLIEKWKQKKWIYDAILLFNVTVNQNFPSDFPQRRLQLAKSVNHIVKGLNNKKAKWDFDLTELRIFFEQILQYKNYFIKEKHKEEISKLLCSMIKKLQEKKDWTNLAKALNLFALSLEFFSTIEKETSDSWYLDIYISFKKREINMNHPSAKVLVYVLIANFLKLGNSYPAYLLFLNVIKINEIDNYSESDKFFAEKIVKHLIDIDFDIDLSWNVKTKKLEKIRDPKKLLLMEKLVNLKYKNEELSLKIFKELMKIKDYKNAEQVLKKMEKKGSCYDEASSVYSSASLTNYLNTKIDSSSEKELEFILENIRLYPQISYESIELEKLNKRLGLIYKNLKNANFDAIVEFIINYDSIFGQKIDFDYFLDFFIPKCLKYTLVKSGIKEAIALNNSFCRKVKNYNCENEFLDMVESYSILGKEKFFEENKNTITLFKENKIKKRKLDSEESGPNKVLKN